MIEDGGGANQRVTRTTLGGLRAHMEVRPPAVWVAGTVVALADTADAALRTDRRTG